MLEYVWCRCATLIDSVNSSNDRLICVFFFFGLPRECLINFKPQEAICQNSNSQHQLAFFQICLILFLYLDKGYSIAFSINRLLVPIVSKF
jgi:hypothetical protein